MTLSSKMPADPFLLGNDRQKDAALHTEHWLSGSRGYRSPRAWALPASVQESQRASPPIGPSRTSYP
ncbi:hypothetical protein BLAT2472_50329 [Burkholderia latens]